MHPFLVGDALPTTSPCVDIFHVDPSHSRDSLERRVRRKCLTNRVDLVQLRGHVTNPEDPYTIVRDRGCKARRERQGMLGTVSDRTRRPTTLTLVIRNKITLSSGVCRRFGS